MTYEQFKERVVESFIDYFDDASSVNIMPVIKNNGIILDGIMLKTTESNLSPTLYLNYYYEQYSESETVDKIAEIIIKDYEANQVHVKYDFDFFLDFEKIKTGITYKLINTRKNLELLEDVPHIEYLDLSIVFYYLVNDLDISKGMSSILIKNEFLSKWNVDVDALMVAATINTPKLLKQNLNQLFETPFYVATNTNSINGAATMLYPNFLKTISQKMGNDLYIIPSSIHEIIIIPATNEYRAVCKDLKETIFAVNRDAVSEQDYLSDNLYMYSQKVDAVFIC